MQMNTEVKTFHIGGPIENMEEHLKWQSLWDLLAENHTEEDKNAMYVEDGWTLRRVPKFIDKAFTVSPLVRDIFTHKVLPAVLTYKKSSH